MDSRRRFLRSSSVLAALLAGRPLTALATVVRGAPGRAALVIGNQRYRHNNPLKSAENDARAMAGLLEQAGFTVDLKVNSTREQMIRAIDEFGRTVAEPGVGVAFFYYAGHAAQLEWRNYLLPVDGDVESAADVRKECVDLGALLGRLAKAKGKTTLIVLDACRDDPFGTRFRPTGKGLSQYDAPPGSLLAFATAPGRVAVEVDGRKHGLYTEHLLRELAVRGVRVEDALKRVRLAVRLASRGAQVPWESTSLETDVYLFPAAKLSAAEVERRLAEELALWTKVRTSQEVGAWVDFLRRFPDGKLAEHAQVHLTRLLAAREPRVVAQPAASEAKGVRLGPGLPIPPQLRRPPSPNSAGTYPFQPTWTVGDEYVYQYLDLYSGVVQRTLKVVVKRVDVENDRVELADGSLLDLAGNVLRGGGREYDVPIQLNPAELQVGRRWTVRFEQTGRHPGSGEYRFRVLRRERIKVPAGDFDAFKIEGEGWFNRRNSTPGNASGSIRHTRWVVPGLNFELRRERLQFGDARVLVSARQRA